MMEPDCSARFVPELPAFCRSSFAVDSGLTFNEQTHGCRGFPGGSRPQVCEAPQLFLQSTDPWGSTMHCDAHLLQGSPTRRAATKPSPDAFCIHCYRSLGVIRDASQRARAEAQHQCPEKLQAKQPATPPPYN